MTSPFFCTGSETLTRFPINTSSFSNYLMVIVSKQISIILYTCREKAPITNSIQSSSAEHPHPPATLPATSRICLCFHLPELRHATHLPGFFPWNQRAGTAGCWNHNTILSGFIPIPVTWNHGCQQPGKSWRTHLISGEVSFRVGFEDILGQFLVSKRDENYEYWQFVPVSQFPMENHLQLSEIIDLNLSNKSIESGPSIAILNYQKVTIIHIPLISMNSYPIICGWLFSPFTSPSSVKKSQKHLRQAFRGCLLGGNHGNNPEKWWFNLMGLYRGFHHQTWFQLRKMVV